MQNMTESREQVAVVQELKYLPPTTRKSDLPNSIRCAIDEALF
jgi:hypothetical protein